MSFITLFISSMFLSASTILVSARMALEQLYLHQRPTVVNSQINRLLFPRNHLEYSAYRVRVNSGALKTAVGRPLVVSLRLFVALWGF